MSILRAGACLILSMVAASLAALDSVAPPAGEPAWGREPVEDGAGQRATICLNGLWRFLPDRRPLATPVVESGPLDGSAWGWIRVPGGWGQGGLLLPGVAAHGSGPAWEGLPTDLRHQGWRQLARGWYQRDLTIPAAWAGRRIQLDLRRIATDAVVWLDGREAGRAASPAGIIDLTAAARPGQAQQLRVLVEAAPSVSPITVMMGAAADQVFTKSSDLRCRGLAGDVLLTSEPAGARLGEVVIRTSVRQGRLDLDLRLEGVADGAVEVAAALRDPNGRSERDLAGTATVTDGRASVGWEWRDARRWDLGHPELYVLDLRVRGAGLDDAWRETFGFREVWIDGRDIWLNGSKARLRPFSLSNEDDQNWGMGELVDGAITGIQGAGFDTMELWPWDQAERGTPLWHDLWCERARARGLGLVLPLQSITQLRPRWQEPAVRAAWERTVAAQIRRQRNNPAVLMWVHTANNWGFEDDQDPRVIGRRAALMERQIASGNLPTHGLQANAFIRACDPTRPVTTHQGGPVGDLHTVNAYPCLAQPQEQAEWLSQWLRDGDMPFWPVEFGPFSLDYCRGRLSGGWGQPFGAIHTEQQTLEHLAGWQGARAYDRDNPTLRRMNAARHEKGQHYRPVDSGAINNATQEHQGDQLREVYRAWRTMGASILPLPWESEYKWSADWGTQVATAPWQPGQRGCWLAQVPVRKRQFLQAPQARPTPAGRALVENNGPTLAWICAPPVDGDPAALTAKDHAFTGGTALKKAVALLNDARVEAAWRLSWTVRVDGKEVASGTDEGRLPTGSTVFRPIACTLPAVERPVLGEIALQATIAGRDHRDRFALRLVPAPAAAGLAVEVLDPPGDSSAVLARLGVRSQTGAAVRVVGRNALASGAVGLGEQLAFVRGGGRLLVLAQDPRWLQRTLGWRTGRQVLRRVFPLDPAAPWLAGLDEQDLRDWNGAGTLVPAYPESVDQEPGYGWHWGNRGSVCSAAIEKPHRAAWRPLLECGFDLAWTALMELDLGAGRVTWCQLDVDGRTVADPLAELLLGRLLRHVAEAPLAAPRAPVAYLGGPEDRALLSDLGVVVGDGPAALVVAGRGAEPSAVAAARAAGARVLCLAAEPAGLAAGEVAAAPAAPAVPEWTWCRGLGRSDLRLAGDAPQQVLPAAVPGFVRGADGLLAQAAGDGPLLAVCLLDPRRLRADERPWLRFSRWRRTHALAQILANLGAAFANDFPADQPIAASPLLAPVPLAGRWAARLTVPLAPSPAPAHAHRDPGPSPLAAAVLADPLDAGAAGWEPVELPATWDQLGKPWSASDGEAVFTRTVTLEGAYAGRALALELGVIDDFDTVTVNGVKVGSTDNTTPSFWVFRRTYPIPAGLLRAGGNRITIRMFDAFGGARVGDSVRSLRLIEPVPPDRRGWYHPDRIEEFAVADDPHRYYRW
jgi:beta-galactosidase